MHIGGEQREVAKLRPFSGRSTICWVLITWPCSLESVCSAAAAPVTSMDSVMAPTCKVASTRCRALTLTPTSVVLNLEKPLASTVIV